MDDISDEREEEVSSIIAIYPELIVHNGHSVSLDLPVTPSSPLLARFVPQQASNNDVASDANDTHAQTVATAYVEHDVRLSHLPSLKAKIDLPDGFRPEGIATGRGPTAYVGSLADGDIRALDLPVVNLGVYGKGAHQRGERVLMSYSFGTLPRLIVETLERLAALRVTEA